MLFTSLFRTSASFHMKIRVNEVHINEVDLFFFYITRKLMRNKLLAG